MSAFPRRNRTHPSPHPLSVVLALGLSAGGASAASLPFINELHYDNVGSDEGEGVEVLALAGTDLTDWSLVLYNGSDGAAYDTISLDGIIDDQREGLGTAYFAIGGMQNGPDGIALVAPDDTVVQFLSYEGSFVATDGPAATLSSLDIMVAEDSSTPLGTSLQLSGRGREVDDFRWIAGADASYGAINLTQEIAAIPLPSSMPLLGVAVAGLLGLRRSAPGPEYS